jgi:hypothetical protein
LRLGRCGTTRDEDVGQRSITVFQLAGDIGEVGRPGLDLVGGVGLRIEHRARAVDQCVEVIDVLLGVDGQRRCAVDEPR